MLEKGILSEKEEKKAKKPLTSDAEEQAQGDEGYFSVAQISDVDTKRRAGVVKPTHDGQASAHQQQIQEQN